MQSGGTSDRVIRFGNFEADLASGELRKHGVRIKLQLRPFQILQVLLERPGEVVTREELRERIWPADTFVDFDHGLNNAIRKLRDALVDDTEKPRYIETLAKRGYRFVAEVKKGSRPSTTVLDQPAIPVGLPANEAIRWIIPAVVVLMASVLTVGWWWIRRQPQRVHSIAVLPFSTADRTANSDDLGDVVTESLIDSLSQIPELRVMSRASAFRFRQGNSDLPRVGKTLKVEAVLVGQVSTVADKIEIATELVKVEDGSHIWGKRYLAQATDLLALQQEIARDVSQKLQPQLSREQKQKINRLPTENPEAYQLYVKGRFFFDRWSADGRTKAVRCFQQATIKDPGFADAFAGLAFTYSIRGFLGESDSEEMAEGEAAARRALTLDSSLAEAHAALGLVSTLNLRWHQAEEESKQAIALNPNCSICHFAYAILLGFTRHSTDAIAEIKKMQAVDPLSFLAFSLGGEVYYFARDYDEAIRQQKIAVEIAPSNPTPYSDLSDAYFQSGMCSEGAAAFSRSEELQGHLENAAKMRRIAESGNCRAAWKIQRTFYADPANPDYYPMSAGVVSALLQEHDQAFKFMEIAYQTRQGIIWLIAEPQLDNVRSDPRYSDLLHRMGCRGNGAAVQCDAL